jgi:hypothetical protein
MGVTVIPGGSFAMAYDPFDGPKVKVQRAKHHVADFKLAYNRFVDSNPATYVFEDDRQTGHRIHKARFTKPFPSEAGLIAADAIYNLRSALDQMIRACTNPSDRAGDDSYFPHGKDFDGFEFSLRSKCKKVPDCIKDALRSLKPYYGGHGYLFRALHDLNLIDKHADLIAVVPGIQNVELGGDITRIDAKWQWGENEVVFATSPIGANHNICISYQIAFADIEAIQNQSVIQVLNKFCEHVGKAIALVEKAMPKE